MKVLSFVPTVLDTAPVMSTFPELSSTIEVGTYFDVELSNFSSSPSATPVTLVSLRSVTATVLAEVRETTVTSSPVLRF